MHRKLHYISKRRLVVQVQYHVNVFIVSGADTQTHTDTDTDVTDTKAISRSEPGAHWPTKAGRTWFISKERTQVS